MLYDMGALDLKSICAADGRDYRKVLVQRAAEKALLNKLGLKPEDINPRTERQQDQSERRKGRKRRSRRRRNRRSIVTHLAHIATRLFNTPLLLTPEYASVVTSVLSDRVGVVPFAADEVVQSYVRPKSRAVMNDAPAS
ncbi:hypothetical protein [Escherichia coli]|uniref:hypothetical protein n=1 Tax=Escherichia coli TaxID=562 RepID=UPI002020FC64|nr:hypothetical protein [Escherichia coli]MCL7471520.1 hypothetical protein [Escherichia coli]